MQTRPNLSQLGIMDKIWQTKSYSGSSVLADIQGTRIVTNQASTLSSLVRDLFSDSRIAH